MRSLSTVLTIAANDLRERLRDRTAFVTAFVAPFIIAAIVSLALGQASSGGSATMTIVDLDRGPAAQALVAAFSSADLKDAVRLRLATSVEEAKDDVRHRRSGAAIEIPSGFSSAPGPVPSIVIDTRSDDPRAGAIAEAVVGDFVNRQAVVRLALTVVAVQQGQPPSGEQIARISSRSTPPLADGETGDSIPIAAYFGPAMGILFVYLTAGFSARAFLRDERQQTLSRMLAAPITAPSLLMGKALSTFALGFTSMVVLYVAMSTVFQARWGPPVPVLALSMIVVATVTVLVSLVVTFCRTDEQANAYTSLLTFGLAIIGGNFIAFYQMPSLLQRLSLATPNGWAMRGFTDLAAGGPLTDAIAPVVALTAMLVVAATVAMHRSERRLLG